MKTLLLVAAFSIGTANAEVLNVNVKNFNFTYKNPHGEGVAASFSRSKINEEVRVSVDKIDKDFRLQVNGAETQDFTFKDAPAFMTEADTMTVSGFNLDLSQRLTMSLASGRFNSPEDSLKLDGVTLDCNRDAKHTEAMDQLISGCVQKMTLKSSKFQQQDVQKVFQGILMETFSKAIDADLGVNSLDLKTNAGKYDLSAEVKAQISGKVKSNGQMSYDAASGKLSVKISEVKFGFLNITGKVFDELKKNESASMQVKEPYVHLTVK